MKFILISELTHAATKIQASFRGHMVRKQMGKDEVAEQKPLNVSIILKAVSRRDNNNPYEIKHLI